MKQTHPTCDEGEVDGETTRRTRRPASPQSQMKTTACTHHRGWSTTTCTHHCQSSESAEDDWLYSSSWVVDDYRSRRSVLLRRGPPTSGPRHPRHS